MNIKHYIGGFATVTLVALTIGAFELSTSYRSLPAPTIETTTYSPNKNNTPVYKSNPWTKKNLEDLEDLQRSLDYLKQLNDSLEKLSPAELEGIQTQIGTADRRGDYTSKLVGALKDGSVKDRQRKVTEVVSGFVCSLAKGLILDGRNTFESQAYGVKAAPHTVAMRYISYPLEPIDTLFEKMGGDDYDYELKNAFEVYVGGAYGFKPSPSGTETTATIICDEVSK